MPPKWFSISSELYIQIKQLLLVLLIRWALKYCITVCHTSICITSYVHYATCSSSTRVCLCATTQARQHMQQSSDCAFSVHRVCVLWNSSYASVCNTYIAQYSLGACLKNNRLLYQHDWTTNQTATQVKFRERNCQSYTA